MLMICDNQKLRQCGRNVLIYVLICVCYYCFVFFLYGYRSDVNVFSEVSDFMTFLFIIFGYWLVVKHRTFTTFVNN